MRSPPPTSGERSACSVAPILVRVSALAVALLASLAILASFALLPSPGLADERAKEEYYARIAKVHPRSAAAHVELAAWCGGRGLDAEALECYRKAIEIDADCAEARRALGYVQRGLRWVKPGEAESEPPPRVRPPSGAGPIALGPAPRSTPPATAAASPAATPLATPATPSPPPSSATPPPEVPLPDVPLPAVPPPEVPLPATDDGTSAEETTAESRTPPAGPAAVESAFAVALEQKRAWAQAAAEKFQTPMATDETADFLVHTTFAKSSRDLKAFQAHLRNLRKTIVSVLPVRSGLPVWPAKVQIVLVRSQPEYERFAEVVDGFRPGRIPEGAYTKDDHTVVLRQDSEALPRVLGATAIEDLNGSDRHLGWWLVDGLSEWIVYAAAAPTRGQEIYRNVMTRAAEEIRKEDGLKIFDIVDSPENPPRFAERNREMAFSLVDFLINYRRRSLQDCIGLLKSEKAPAPPQTKDEFNYFYASYVSFQEESINSTFRQSLEDLDQRWKRYVLSVAEKLKAQEPRPTAPTAPATKKRN